MTTRVGGMSMQQTMSLEERTVKIFQFVQRVSLPYAAQVRHHGIKVIDLRVRYHSDGYYLNS